MIFREITEHQISSTECAYCGNSFSSTKKKTVEHIYSKFLLKQLGWKDYIKTSRDSKGNITVRSHPTKSVVAGGICSGCNNGWMNDIDVAVIGILIDCMNDNRERGVFSNDEGLLITRFLLKTHISKQIAESSERRHLAHEIVREMERPDFIPPGIVTFVAYTYGPIDGSTSRYVTSSLDVWALGGEITNQNQRNWIKFAFKLKKCDIRLHLDISS